MSLETAREWYKLAKQNEVSSPAVKFLEENFSKEELEGGDGFIWEDSFGNEGYYVADGEVICMPIASKTINMRGMFKTESQAKSALAFAQLTHIVDKYNQHKYPLAEDGTTALYQIQAYTDGRIGLCKITPFDSISFVSAFNFFRYEDAKISMKVNEQLWKDYFMINSTTSYVK